MKSFLSSVATLFLASFSVASAASRVVMVQQLPPREASKMSEEPHLIPEYKAIFHAAPLFQDLSHATPWTLDHFHPFAPSAQDIRTSVGGF